jgi:hypothetical protein
MRVLVVSKVSYSFDRHKRSHESIKNQEIECNNRGCTRPGS